MSASGRPSPLAVQGTPGEERSARALLQKLEKVER
jgi:hypothetical protein